MVGVWKAMPTACSGELLHKPPQAAVSTASLCKNRTFRLLTLVLIQSFLLDL
jgi:hypothetical protein